MTSPFADHLQSATIQIPSDPSGTRRTVLCAVQEADRRRLVLEAEERIAASTALSVEYNDAMFLGEVMVCSPTGDNTWKIELKIEQILTGLQSLMALRAGLLGESAPQPFAEPAVAVSK
ncbi:MAG TPA: hypothetical protein VF283_02970 [Bryobacteraceae bacterium]